MRALLLEYGGLGLQHLGFALGGSTKAATAAAAAAAAAAAWGLPNTCVQVMGYRRSAKPQQKNTLELQTELERQLEEAYELLQPLECSRAFVQRVFARRFREQPSPPHASFPQELLERMYTLQEITQATTQQKRAALVRKLWHSVEVLNLKPDKLHEKAAALAEQLQQLQGITSGLAQRLITTQPVVLIYEPYRLAQKMADMAQRLGMEPPKVLDMWLRQRSMVMLTMDTINAKMLDMAGLLHLQDEELRKLVVRAPTLLASDVDVVRARFANLLETLPRDIWTAEMLGAALLSSPAVLTYKPESVRYKWDVVCKYAALHEPSREQLQERQQSPRVLNFFTRGDEQIAMLEYITQQPPVLQQAASMRDAAASSTDTCSSSSSDADDDIEDGNFTSRQQSPSSSSSSSSQRGRGRGRPTMSVLVAGQSGPMPLLMCVLSPSKAKWAAVQQLYPGFADWYEQRQEQQRKQRQQRADEAEED